MSKGSLYLIPVNSSVLAGMVTPKYEVVQLHHLTVAFGVELDSIDSSLLGEKVTVHLTDVCWNHQIEALVAVFEEFPFDRCPVPKGVPHITVSHTKDVAPVESNRMLITRHHRKPLSCASLVMYFHFHKFPTPL